MVKSFLVAALLIASPIAAYAQQSPYPPAIAKGEVLLQISADGEVKTVADKATIMGQIVGRGKDAASARNAADKQLAVLTERLVSFGISNDQISQPAQNMFQMFDRNTDPTEPEDSEANPFSSNRPVMVEFSDIASANQVRTTMETAGVRSVGNPIYLLASDANARQRAAADAIAHARVQAENYAAPLGMQVLRVVRVSNDNNGGMASMYGPEFRQMSKAMMANMGMGKGAEGNKVVTTATVWVDFVIGPKP